MLSIHSLCKKSLEETNGGIHFFIKCYRNHRRLVLFEKPVFPGTVSKCGFGGGSLQHDRRKRMTDQTNGIACIIASGKNLPNGRKIAGYLERNGFIVFSSEHGENILELSKTTDPDVILLYADTDDYASISLCRRIKGTSLLKDTPVLFSGDSTALTYRIMAFKAGAADYLDTAMAKEEVLRRILVHVAHRKNLTAYKECIAEKDNSLSFLAHELKNPLVGLIGVSDLLISNSGALSQSEIERLLSSINTAANGALKLLDNILKHTKRRRMESIIHEQGGVPLFEVVQKTLLLLDPMAVRKNIRIDNRISDDAIVLDENEMISTVIRNLAVNALKFTEAGGEIIIASSVKGEFIEISVTDTGIGIPPENVESLFQAEVGGSRTGSGGEQGTGLGLMICKEMIESNGGRMRIDSREGKGTTVRFTVAGYQMTRYQCIQYFPFDQLVA